MKNVILKIAVLGLLFAVSIWAEDKPDCSKCSMYVPPCMDLHPKKPENKNMLTFTGSVGKALNNEQLFTVGYHRTVKDDLAFTLQTIFTDKRYLTTTLGFGYRW